MENNAQFTWFDLSWPWIGLGLATLLLILLFSTNLLRHNPAVSRWRDAVWLSWLAIPIYMIHQFEEYGVDLLGQKHAFPDALCGNLGLGNYPACPIPHEFYLYVNIPLVWLMGVLNSRYSLKNPFVGLGLYSVVISNGMVHIMLFIVKGQYNPGVFTAITIFLPSFFWLCKVCFGKERFPNRGIVVLVATGIILHAILISSVLLFVHQNIGDGWLDGIQAVNATTIFFIPLLGDRWLRVCRFFHQ
jgi:hypothetical protein